MESLQEVTNALSNGAIPDPLRLPLLQDWGFTTHPKTVITIISETAKAMDCKFGRYIHRVHDPSEHQPMKNFGKKGAWAYSGTAQFFWSTPYYLRNG